jgi:hypothetical protein
LRFAQHLGGRADRCRGRLQLVGCIEHEVASGRFEPSSLGHVHDDDENATVARRGGGESQPSRRRRRLDLHHLRLSGNGNAGCRLGGRRREQLCDRCRPPSELSFARLVGVHELAGAVEEEYPFLHRGIDHAPDDSGLGRGPFMFLERRSGPSKFVFQSACATSTEPDRDPGACEPRQ